MPSSSSEHALVTLLKHCYSTPKCQALRCSQRALSSSSSRAVRKLESPRHQRQVSNQRVYSTRSRVADYIHFPHRANSSALSQEELHDCQSPILPIQINDDGSSHNGEGSTRIAVLGGGITGLSSAYYLTKLLPHAKVTLYESSDRLGGWLQSKHVDVRNGRILFEQGPRTLRPSGLAAWVTLEMAKDLGLENEILTTPKTSPAAQNRFIYYPDHLVRMPNNQEDMFTNLWTVITEPIFKGSISALWEGTRASRPANLEDEPISSFLARRTGGTDLSDNIVSAVLHGIYAGDIEQLSARSLLARPFQYEVLAGSISHAMYESMFKGFTLSSMKEAKLVEQRRLGWNPIASLDAAVVNASVYSFKEGISTLSDALEKALKRNPNVTFRINSTVTDVKYEGQAITIKAAPDHPQPKYDRVISTISGRALDNITSHSVPSLQDIHSVTVMVVNLYYTDPHILPEHGFGYLIPRSLPYEQNPEFALGVVFDSDAIQGQDAVPGTKITVMLGGHWWDDFESYPDEEEGAAMAKSVIARHLKIDVEPAAVHVSLNRECIPQYKVGHELRLRLAHRDLMQNFGGKLAVAGNTYTGVAVNDCITAARSVAMAIKDGGLVTGLEDVGLWVSNKPPRQGDSNRSKRE